MSENDKDNPNNAPGLGGAGAELDLGPIKARLKMATPGPWRWADWNAVWNTWENPENKRVLEHNPKYDFRNSVILVERDVEVQQVIKIEDERGAYEEADLELIEHAPTDIAALVTEVERLRREVNTMAWSSYDQIIDKRWSWDREFEPPYPDVWDGK